MDSTAAANTEQVHNGADNAPVYDPQTEAPDATVTETITISATTEPAKPEVDSVTENPPPASEASPPDAAALTVADDKKWPGWPGHCVFRLIVPVVKVGSIIGRKGDLIKKMCDDTKARIRVLDGPVGTPDRIVLISGKEEIEAPLSPAMDAVIRVFKRVSGLPESEGDVEAPGAAFCSIRLLVASMQAIHLIGKQGSLIKSIQESTSASIRVRSTDDAPYFATSDERIVELQGEALSVLKALEAVVGHLRKFLVDHSVLPLFEKSYNTTVSQEREVEAWADKSLRHSASQTGPGADYPLSSKRDSRFLDRETQLEPHIPTSGLSLYGQDTGFSGIRSSGLGRAGGPIVTQVAQTMQIPLTYAEDIIGIGGANIAYIRRTSGAILTVEESRGLPDEITVEIKGTSSQVQTAQQLIQEFISSHKEPIGSSYDNMDTGFRSSYSQLGNTAYPPSTRPYGGYESASGLGGYSSYRY